MSKEEIMKMIVNLPPPTTEIQMNFETVYDFVIERVSETDMCQFPDVASIVTWLHSDNTYSNESHPVAHFRAQNPARQESTLVKMLKPGTKIIIPKPRPNDKKFSNIESAQAYLNQNIVYQSVDVDFDDSEEVDVISYDCSSPWNQFYMPEPQQQPKARKNSRMHRVLTEKQPTATYTCNARTIIQPKKKTIKATNVDAGDEPSFECQSCDRKYKRKSSLIRHEKIHLAKDDDNNTTIQNIPTKHATIIPLNAAELIST